VKKAIVASRSRTAIPTFSNLMGMGGTLPSQHDSLRSAGGRSGSVGQGTTSQSPAPDPRSISVVRARSLTCPPDTAAGLPGPAACCWCRERNLARSASRATIGLRDKLMDGVAGGGVTQPLTRLLDDSVRTGVRPDSVQALGGTLSLRLPTPVGCGSISVCVPPDAVTRLAQEGCAQLAVAMPASPSPRSRTCAR
jgi:hypothetical protein